MLILKEASCHSAINSIRLNTSSKIEAHLRDGYDIQPVQTAIHVPHLDGGSNTTVRELKQICMLLSSCFTRYKRYMLALTTSHMRDVTSFQMRTGSRRKLVLFCAYIRHPVERKARNDHTVKMLKIMTRMQPVQAHDPNVFFVHLCLLASKRACATPIARACL